MEESSMTDPREVTSPHPDCPFVRAEWEGKMNHLIQTLDARQVYHRWALGLALSIFGMLAGLLWNGLDLRVRALEQAGSAPMRERIAAIEAVEAAQNLHMAELTAGQRELLVLLRAHTDAGKR